MRHCCKTLNLAPPRPDTQFVIAFIRQLAIRGDHPVRGTVARFSADSLSLFDTLLDLPAAAASAPASRSLGVVVSLSFLRNAAISSFKFASCLICTESHVHGI